MAAPSSGRAKRVPTPLRVSLALIVVVAVGGPLLLGWLGQRPSGVVPIEPQFAKPGRGSPILIPARTVSMPATPTSAAVPEVLEVLVVGAGAGQPIPHAEVLAYSVTELGLASAGNPAQEARSGSDGVARVSANVEGWVVFARAPGYAPARQVVRGTRRVTLSLQSSAEISGRVVSASGEPVPGIVVHAIAVDAPVVLPSSMQRLGESLPSIERPMQTTTTGNGEFQIDGLALGARYIVTIRTREWQRTEPPVSGDGTTVAPTSGVTLVVEPLWYVRVRLLNSHTGKPVGLALRTCDVADPARRVRGQIAVVGRAWTHELPGLGEDILFPVRGAEAVRVLASAHGFQPSTAVARALTWNEVAQGQSDAIPITPLLPVLQQSKQSAVLVRAKALPPTLPSTLPTLVVSLAAGEGELEMGGVVTTYQDIPIAGRVLESGDVQFSEVPSGRRTVHVDWGGVRSKRVELDLPADELIELVPELVAARVIEVIVRSKTGPLLDAAMALASDDGLPVLQALSPGAYRHLIRAPAGAGKLLIWRSGFKNLSIPIEGEGPDTRTVEVVMEPTAD